MNIKRVVLIIILSIFYLFVVNVLAELAYGIGAQRYQQIQGGASVVLTVGNSVSIEVTRPRWYGTIKEFDGNSFLYLFKFVRVPLHTRNFNFIWSHIPFLLIIVLIIFIRSKPQNLNSTIPLLSKNGLEAFF